MVKAKVTKAVARKALFHFKRELANDGEEVACMQVAIQEVLNEINRGYGWHRPVCRACQIEMHPEHNGVGVLDMSDYGPDDLWEADLWKCPKCGHEIVSGFGSSPISSHYKGEQFQELVQAYRDYTIVVECRS